MATKHGEFEHQRGSGFLATTYVLATLFVMASASLAVLAFNQNPGISIIGAIETGFTATGGLIIALFAGLFSVAFGLVAALFGIAVGGGAIAITLFIIASPIIAILLFVLLARQAKRCPDPAQHL